MGFTSGHIRQFFIATAIVILAAGDGVLNAQEPVFPERWNKSLRSVAPIFQQDTLTIRLLGDVMMHQNQIENALKADGSFDFDSYFMFIEDEIREADLAVANMEFTLAGKPYAGYPCFSAPDPFADYLAGCGFDIFLAANNHIFDKGTEGAERTLEIYRRLHDTKGIRFTGLAGNEDEMKENNPLRIRIKGIRIAFLNFTYGTNLGLKSSWPRTNYLGEKTKAAGAFETARKFGADFIFALPHWGTEYVLEHSGKQEREAAYLAENGADFIIGAHPHVIQDMGMAGDVPVVYSLGNAVSNMSATNTQLELMATIRIVRHWNGDLEALPLELKYLWCSRPGGYNDSYTVIPVAEFIGRKDEWKGREDYYRMIDTYERVKKETGINE